ncbi:Diaminohydroxyphosphoribosylamino-pyrimidine deaminase [Cyphellophora attinorum]|uniref:Diaminohydroxyphosphoribosylamino-pyrimidine deaminase n=1 Tax=Cyphellophora attinorum TaxID=1664694 RepID=A0A0N0NMR8_9EURO|nr:Diaminohydroxyphosphoribosylamino-pyrimidine deaminase [Phialophora attinorum]KPI40668.1 Diaminohydroxyphosphoribosylamino-pyrimidine deaminase [Phialophora attinorum]
MNEALGEQVRDASDETFVLFSQDLPSNSLGFVDAKADEIDIDIGIRSFVLKQSPGLLISQRDTGTTGAVLWKVSPLVAQWLTSKPAALYEKGILSEDATVVELGCGITGLIGVAMSPHVDTYVLTDQAYISKRVHENIAECRITQKARGASKAALRFVELDWEKDKPSRAGLSLRPGQNLDLIIACDCIYNDFLIKPLVQTMIDLCRLKVSSSKPTAVLVAQQLRDSSIFEDFMASFLDDFDVWRLADDALPAGLRLGSGYTVHLAWLRERLSD